MLSGQPQGLAPTVNNRKKESLKLLAALSPQQAPANFKMKVV
jgi:hypothetical protein